jgi:formylglycine-generating enzyme required for sulfatase activity
MSVVIGSFLPATAQNPPPAAQEQTAKPNVFRDCESCPEMVVVPAGSFAMGSPKDEEGRFDNEGPQHEVKIPRPLAVGRLEVTVDQFAAFVKETGRDMGSTCDVWEKGKWSERPGRSWRDPGFAQSGTHPVACVSWDDAKAYVAWLSARTGKPYRLPSEAEWEYAARAGTTTRFHFGNDEKDFCRHGNGADRTAQKDVPGAKKWTVLACQDGHAYTAPTGSFATNGFGLHDMHGNLWEWTEDCWHDSYAGAPADGSAWTTGGDCKVRVLRGGSWGYPPRYLRTAVRGQIPTAYRYVNDGFRVVLTLAP